MRRFLATALAASALAAPPSAAQAPYRDPPAPQGFSSLVEEYLSFHFYFDPVEATSLGVHDYDGRLSDLSRDGLFRLVAAYHQWLNRVRSIRRDSLRGDDYWDHRILEYGIRARILELEEIRSWEKDPLFYVDQLTAAIIPLAEGDFAPASQRLEALVARERQVPRLLSQARANLLSPPRTLTELAVARAREAIRLVRDELPRAFETVPQGPPLERFKRVNQQTIEELRRFQVWLEEDLLSGSRGDLGVGADLLRQKLVLKHHLDLPVEELRRVVEGEIERYQRWVESEAQGVDPAKPPREVIRAIVRDVNSADAVLSLARGLLPEARDFVISEDLLTLPDGSLPGVRGVSPYRAAGLAVLVGPPPFGQDLSPSGSYLVALPDPAWEEDQRRAHLALLSAPSLLAFTLREAYPGRYVEALYARQVPSRVRRTFRTGTLESGWALYALEMALDRGFRSGEPELRIAQLRTTLLELARLRAALAIHAGGASLEDATGLIQEAAYMEPFPARREAERVAANPTEGVGALGKMQISQLRADYQEYLSEGGETYVLGNFHDRFLRLGVPIPMARKILMPGDEGPSLPPIPGSRPQ